MKLLILSSDPYGEKLLGNLICSSELLERCPNRASGRDYSAEIVGFFQLPQSLPPVLENPREYLPASIDCDVIIGIKLHPDLIPELPRFGMESNAKLILIPREDPSWAPSWARNRALRECSRYEIEMHFPAPFCSLTKTRSKLVSEFISHFRSGFPELKIETRNGMISKLEVITSAPCGSSWYVAQQLIGAGLEDPLQLESLIVKHLGDYPCTASMQLIPPVGDALRNRAGLMLRQAFQLGLGLTSEPTFQEIESGILSQECLGCGNCLGICELNWRAYPQSSYGKRAWDRMLRLSSGRILLRDWMHCTRCAKCYSACPLRFPAYNLLLKRDKLWLLRWEQLEDGF